MPGWTTIGALALGCVFLAVGSRRYSKSARSRHSHPLPPGPPGLPFLGNLLQLNSNAPWLTYTEWAKTYGDLVYFRVFNNELIVINSEEAAKELLDDHSSSTSGRPNMITNKLCGLDSVFVFMPYGERWRSHRRFYHQTFRREAAQRFIPMQDRKACQLLRRVLESPEDLSEHAFEYTSSLILSGVYDYDATSRQDELVKIVGKVLEVIVPMSRPDIAFILGAFPALLKLPSWFPGMSIKKRMTEAKNFAKEYVEKPFATTLQKTATGSWSSSMIYDALQSVEEKGVSTDETWIQGLKESAATGLLAASETSHGVLRTCLLMMLMTPEAQKKAHMQIDAVVGNNRLPTIEDRASLPYIDAIMREVFRYRPVTPLSGVHAATDDDVYAGYHIPKGAVLLPNTWAMTRNAVKFPNPEEFIPERFLNEDGSLKSVDFDHLIYGFGRRVCVGKHFADTSVWLAFVKFLAVFQILQPLDEDGVEIPVKPGFTSGIVVHPLPYKFRIVPRIPGLDAAKLEELIQASAS